MNQKFTLDQYEICVNFKSDNVLVISAEFLPTGELFLSQTVELLRIKKDTVIATLERKSEKNLRCELEQLVGRNQKQLVIKFIVSFDFLPEFNEEVVLEYVQKKDKIKSLQANNFRADIQQMERMIDNLQINGVCNFNQISSVGCNQSNTTMKTLEVAKGKYLIRISGIYTNSQGVMGQQDSIHFQITTAGKAEAIKKIISAHSISGYSYPFAFEEVVDCNEGELKIQARSSANQATFTNLFVLSCPIPEFR